MSGQDPAFTNTEVDDNFVEFIKFIKKFDAEYKNKEEFEVRFKIFVDNLKKIDELNKTPGQTATFGINKFTDRTEHERQRSFGLVRKPPKENAAE